MELLPIFPYDIAKQLPTFTYLRGITEIAIFDATPVKRYEYTFLEFSDRRITMKNLLKNTSQAITHITRTLPLSLLLIAGLSPAAKSNELRYQAVWNAGSGSNIVTEPLSRSEFVTRGEELTAQGLRLIDVETAQVNGDRIYTGVWVSGTGSNLFEGPMTRAEFRTARQEKQAQGLMLVDFEVFRNNNGQRQFLGVWRPGSGEEKLTLPRNADEFIALGQQLTAEGLRLVDVEVEQTENGLKYRGLWQTGTGSNIFSDARSPEAFRSLRDQMVADGLELVDIERIGAPGSQQFVSVWASGNGASRLSQPRNFESFVTFGQQQTANGQRTRDIEIFQADETEPTTFDDDDSENPNPGNPGNPDTTGNNSLPPWIQLSGNPYLIVDFGTFIEEQPVITIPADFLPLLPYNTDGSPKIPDDFCGFKVRRADAVFWQRQDGEVVTDFPYNTVEDVSDLDNEFFLGGIQFTGPIGQCTEDNNPWQFAFPITQTSGDSPTSGLKLVIQMRSDSELEFLNSN